MHTAKPPPHTGPEFEAMMREVDAALIAEGKPIESRPIQAVGEISVKYGIPIPMSFDETRLPPELRAYAPLGAAIHRWYEETYADRLKIDFNVGRTVVRLDGDLYRVKVPQIYGHVRFVMSRAFSAAPRIQQGPAICNLVQLVEGLTPAKAALLSDDALRNLDDGFDRALHAAYTLASTDHHLMASARGDFVTAITNLMARDDRFGAAKWASLQAAEKVMKAAIELQGDSFKFTHELGKLSDSLNKAGIPFGDPVLLQAIQCSPTIRYGDEPCTQDEALAAHHASLTLVNRLRDAGAKFVLGVGGKPPR